jgi:D-3-phosphoglycerate dehydrogenase
VAETPLIVLTDRDFGDDAIDAEQLSSFRVRRLDSRDPGEIVARAGDADGLLVQWAPITADVLTALPRLRAIVRYGVGLDNIDLRVARERGVTVQNVDDYCVDEVADHAIAAIVADNRRLVDADRAVKAGDWTSGGWRMLPPDEEPVGIAGMGRIGRALAARAERHGFPVHYYDPFLPEDALAEAGIRATRHDSLVDLAAASRHLSLHLPLSDETRGVIGAEVIAALGPDGHLVNASRGALIDEAALLTALDDGVIRRASLDVLAAEPPTDGTSLALARHPRVLVTPHIAYSSTRAMRMLQSGANRRLVEALA